MPFMRDVSHNQRMIEFHAPFRKSLPDCEKARIDSIERQRLDAPFFCFELNAVHLIPSLATDH